MTDRVKEILSWYGADNPGTLANLAKILNHGKLAGTGRMVILPVDQGFEHGPFRSFLPNPPGFDPRYHHKLAIESGCNAYAAPLGALESSVREFAGDIPLILKGNHHDLTLDERDPTQAHTATIPDALRLGCCAVGYTIYPGSERRFEMYEMVRDQIAEAKECGLVTILWSYPRGSGITKDGETSLDVAAYAAHIACQLGAHIVKVKLPTAKVEFDANAKAIEKSGIKTATMSERVGHIVKSCFDGRRIVIFSGGALVSDEEIYNDAKAIHAGGGFGSIMGRNSFQRPKKDALELLGNVMDIYKK